MHLAHRPDGAVGEPFVDEPVALESHSLVAHLRGHFCLPRRERQRARLLHGAGERLLTINVSSELDRHHARRSMVVVRYAHCDCVQRFLGLKQLAIIPVTFRRGEFCARTVQVVLIHVAERDDVHIFDAGDFVHIVATATGDADEGDVQFFVC